METDLKKFLEATGNKEIVLQPWQQEIFDKLENAVKNGKKITVYIPRAKRTFHYRNDND